VSVHGAEDLIRAISHDLNTPLARASLHLDEAARWLDDGAPARRAIDEATREIHGIGCILVTLVAIERMRLGDPRHVFGIVRADALVLQVAELFDAAVEQGGGRIERDVDADVELVGEETLLLSMLVHLTDNAVRHCPAGGLVRLGATRAVDGSPTLAVADSGPGIPPAAHARVLAPFHRLEPSRTAGGHGLGLAYVDAVVRRHDAELRFEDAAPGLRAVVTFPRP